MNHSPRLSRPIDIFAFVVFLVAFCSRMMFLDRLDWHAESGLQLLRAVEGNREFSHDSKVFPGIGGFVSVLQERVYSVGFLVFGRELLSPFLAEALLVAILSMGAYGVLRTLLRSRVLAATTVVSSLFLPEWNLFMRGVSSQTLGVLSFIVLSVLAVSAVAVRLHPRLTPRVLSLTVLILLFNGWRSVNAIQELPSVASALQAVAWIERTRANAPVVLVTYDTSSDFLNYLNYVLTVRDIPLEGQGVRYVLTMERDAVLPVQNSMITAFDTLRIARRTGNEH